MAESERNYYMNRVLLIVTVVLLCNLYGPTQTANAGPDVTSSQHKKQKLRSQVMGLGKTSSEASSEARSSATKVAGSYSFSTISQKTTGKGDNWTCILIFEYEVK